MSRPARRPKTRMSTSEFVPRRLAPCTETQAHSPAPDDTPPDVRGDAADGVVRGRIHGDEVATRIQPQVGVDELDHFRKSSAADLFGHVAEVKEDAVAVRPSPAPRGDLPGDGARGEGARGGVGPP